MSQPLQPDHAHTGSLRADQPVAGENRLRGAAAGRYAVCAAAAGVGRFGGAIRRALKVGDALSGALAGAFIRRAAGATCGADAGDAAEASVAT